MNELELSLNKYQELAGRTDGSHPWEYYLIGLSGEAGEALEIAKKVVYHDHPITSELNDQLKKELGDALWYVARAANKLGLTLQQVAVANIDKLSARYPDRFSPTLSQNRSE